MSSTALCMGMLDQWNTLHSMGEHSLALDQTGIGYMYTLYACVL